MWDAKKFRREESGALLVFFALCAAAIFLVAALSFDVGRRASTQTDLQSFADNVALAAAGELNGLPGSIARARRAADQLIDDETRFSDANDLGGLGDFDLTFYETLPDNETTWATPVAYDAAQELNPGDAQARFVRIEVDPVNVEWQFANILTLFSSDPLPSEAVAAEATAGYTSLACDVAPVFFCMPPVQPEDTAAGSPIWDPENHLGESVLLRTGGGSNAWGAGNFGWLDVVEMTPDEAKTDPASPCFGLTGSSLYSCLIGAESALTLCFENGNLRFLTGQRNGITPAVLNTKFDMYDASLSQEQNDSRFRPGPIVTKPYAENTTCAPAGGPGGGPPPGPAPIDDSTTHFPPDDCFESSPYTGCLIYSGDPRFGDGDWSQGRLDYVENNYSIDADSIDTITAAELVGGYHIDDPFRPAIAAQGGNPAAPRKPEYVTANYPIVDNDAWRWHYYNAEIAAAYFANPAQAYIDALGEVNITETLKTTPVDLVKDYEDIDGNLVQERAGTSLPHCAPDASLNPRRRTIVAAVVDCVAEAGELNGQSGQGTATWFVEVFLPSVTGGVTTNGNFDMYVEVISGGLQTGDPSFANGTFRNLVQLYR